MADITKDSFNEANDFTKVVFQRGRDIMDFELNEFQDILRVFSARLGQVGVGRWQAPASVNYVYSSDNGLQVTANGVANQVVVGAGTFLADGIEQAYASPLTVTLPAADATVKYDVIYAEITEVEVADPNAVPQIGPTTVRRQLSVVLNHYRTAVLPIDASMPANPATWLWQGQTRYFALAVVTRPASNNTIADSNILDLRLQTPSRTLAEAARVEDFTLQALITPVLETPVRNVSGIDNALLIDINKANSAVAVGLDDTVTLRSRANGGVGIPQTMAVVTRYAATTNGVPGRFALGTNYALYGTPTLRFQDDYVVTGYGGVTDKFVRFSSNVGSGSVLRLGEQSAAVQNAAGVLSAQNMLKALNGRVHVSVGDGVQSFGDFTGQDAIEQALAFYAAALTAGATVSSFEIDLKRGTYIVAASPGAIAIAAGTKVTITGDNPASTIIQVPSGRSSGITVNTGATLTLKNIRMTGGSSATPLMTTGSAAIVTTENCQFYADGYGVISQGSALLSFRRSEFKAVTGVVDTPLVQFRIGHQSSGNDYVFEDCNFSTIGRSNIPVVRVVGTGTYTTSSSIKSVQFIRCTAELGGALNTRDAFNPSAVNTGLLDLAANGANINNVYSTTSIDRIVISGCSINVTSTAADDCLTALRITATPVDNFSGVLFTGGFLTVNYLQVQNLRVSIDGSVALNGANAVSPVVVGLFHAHMQLEDVLVQNVTTAAAGINNGKIPYDAYMYFTPDGSVAPAPNSGAKATNAVSGIESASVAISNRWYGVTHYALTTIAQRNPQPTTQINNLRIFGFERGSSSVHTCGGELFVHASGTYAYISDLEVSNYKNSSAATKTFAPESRVKLMTTRLNVFNLCPAPIMDVRRVNMTGYYARQGAISALTISNPGSGYTNGFYAGTLTSGGSPALVNVLVQGGVVTQVTIANPSSGFAVGDVLTLALPTGTGAQLTVTAVSPATQWLVGSSFAGASGQLPSTNDAAYLLLADRTTNAAFPDPSNATINLTDVDISGYRTESAVAQGAAIGCYAVGSSAISITSCQPNVGRGIYLAAPPTTYLVGPNARFKSVNISSCIILPDSSSTGNGMTNTITVDCGANQLLISNNTVSGAAVGTEGAVTVAQYNPEYAGAMQISGNVFACPSVDGSTPNNVSLRFLCNSWPLGVQVVPRAVVTGNTCRLPSGGGGTTNYGIYFNNKRQSAGGTLPNTDQIPLSLTNSRGLETEDTAYNGTDMHFTKSGLIIHNDAFLWTDS